MTRTNVLLAVALAVSLALNWGVRARDVDPGTEFFPNMAHSPRANAFAANDALPNGQTLQAPEPGTIARGQRPLHYAATPADAIRAGNELRSPVPPDDAHAIARGAIVFASFCQPCHGGGGRGDGPVTVRGVPPPPSLLAEHALGLADGQIFHILTFGQVNMASYASQVSREDRWNVIAYVRTLQAAAPKTPPPGTTPAAVPAPSVLPASGGPR